MMRTSVRTSAKKFQRSCRGFQNIGTGLFIMVCVLAVPAFRPASAQSGGRSFSLHPKTFQVGPNPSAIAVADLTDDGLPDIVTADRGELHNPREERPANDELSLLIAETPFNYARRHPSLKTGIGPYALALANVDGLKWPDIIAVNFLATRDRHVSVFLNLKDEGVFKPLEFPIPETGLEYYRHYDGEDIPLFTKPGLTSVIVHDLNKDGSRDLLATGWSSDVLLYMPGNPETIFGPAAVIPATGAPRALSLADLDGDGNEDLAVVMYATAEIALFKGGGNGGFAPRGRFKTRGNLPTTVLVRDMNGDGLLDIVTSHAHTDDSIVIFYGDGPFSYSLSQEIMLGSHRDVLEHEIRDIAIADLTGNGRMDIVAACHASGSVVVLRNTSGDAGLRQQYQMENYRFSEGKPRTLQLADLDNDGHLDIAVALWETNTVGLLRNSH
ncbi:MAG TPA: VCBS repeat-containing protein [Candidatus Hydrogenedentes bacterium]|nr:VCBS repeat-containing protein [Candidatus Hydrogenedentota bacterium]